MFTDDISLKIKDIYKEFIEYYGEKLKYINVFTLPHHSSHHNWNKNIQNQLKKECILVISSDPNNRKYNHPNKSVIYDITYEGRSIKYVDLIKYFYNKHYCK